MAPPSMSGAQPVSAGWSHNYITPVQNNPREIVHIGSRTNYRPGQKQTPATPRIGLRRTISPNQITVQGPGQDATRITLPIATTPKEILHIGGSSAFFRAHQADYLDRVNKQLTAETGRPAEWHYAVANLRSDTNAFAKQSGEFHHVAVDENGNKTVTTNTSVGRVIRKSENHAKIAQAIAEPNVAIATMTLSPAGYHYNAQTKLDVHAEDVKADLNGAHKTVYSVLADGLEKRRRLNTPLAIMSCDNVRKNGDNLKEALLSFMLLRGQKDLHNWTQANVSFPNSMVDRITPKPNDELKKLILDKTGKHDDLPVLTEASAAWIIEKKDGNFPLGRPQWEKAGVKFVPDVDPHEEAKLRILNAAHSGLSWTGAVRGHEFIHDAVKDPVIKNAVRSFLTKDVVPALGDSPVPLHEYCDEVLQRFSNPALQDTVARISRNGVSKIPLQYLSTLQQRVAAGAKFDATASLIANHYTMAKRDFEGKLGYSLVETPAGKNVLSDIFKSSNPLKAYCSNKALFGELAGHPGVEAAIARGINQLEQPKVTSSIVTANSKIAGDRPNANPSRWLRGLLPSTPGVVS